MGTAVRSSLFATVLFVSSISGAIAAPKKTAPKVKPGTIQMHKFGFTIVDTDQDRTPSFFEGNTKLSGAPCAFTGKSYYNMFFFGVMVSFNKRAGDQLFVGGIDEARTIKVNTRKLVGQQRVAFKVSRKSIRCIYRSNNNRLGLVLLRFINAPKQKWRYAVLKVELRKRIKAEVIGTVTSIAEAKKLAGRIIPSGSFKLPKPTVSSAEWKSFYGKGYQEICPLETCPE